MIINIIKWLILNIGCRETLSNVDHLLDLINCGGFRHWMASLWVLWLHGVKCIWYSDFHLNMHLDLKRRIKWFLLSQTTQWLSQWREEVLYLSIPGFSRVFLRHTLFHVINTNIYCWTSQAQSEPVPSFSWCSCGSVGFGPLLQPWLGVSMAVKWTRGE